MTGDTEGTWIAVGDRLFDALGMRHAEHRHSRRAIKQACATVRKTDPRYAAGSLELLKLGSSWRIQAERPTWEAWKAQSAEQAEARKIIAQSLAQARTEPPS